MDQNIKVAQIINVYNALQTRWKTFRTAQARNYDYAIGKMIADSVRQSLINAERPIFEFQLATQMIEYLIGKLKGDMVRMKAVPVSQGDEDSSAMRTQMVNWAIGDAGYRAIAEAAVDSVIGRIGVVNNYWTNKRIQEGEYMCRSVDPFLVLFDPESREQDGSDEKYVIYHPWHTSSEILEMYQKYLDSQQIEEIERTASLYEGRYKNTNLPRSWYERIYGELKYWSNTFGKYQGMEEFVRAENSMYQVIEFHDRRIVSKKVMYDPTTRDFEILEDGKDKDPGYLQGLATQTKQTDSGESVQRFVNPTVMNVKTEMIWITSICPALMPRDVLMELPYEVQRKGFALKKILFRRLHPDVTESQSLMDRLIAPLDFYSQSKMTAMEAVRRDVHPDVEYPEHSIDQENIADWTSKKTGKLKMYKPQGNLLKPETKQQASHVFQMLKVFADEGMDLIEYCGGVSLNARGYAQNPNESGTVFQARTQQTEVMVADLVSNVTLLSTEVWNFCMETLRRYQTTERMVRLLDDNENPYWLTINQRTVAGIKNDITQGEYDFIADKAATGKTQKRENVAILSQTAPLVQHDPIASQYLAAIIFANMDIPDAKKLSKFIMQRVAQQMGMETEEQFQKKSAGEMALAARAKQLMTQSERNGNGKNRGN